MQTFTVVSGTTFNTVPENPVNIFTNEFQQKM